VSLARTEEILEQTSSFPIQVEIKVTSYFHTTAILVREGFWHADDRTFLSLQSWCQGEHLPANDNWARQSSF